MGAVTQFGNTEVAVADVVRLGQIAGKIREESEEGDTIYLHFTRDLYAVEEVLELLQIVARMQPDECDMDNGDLRLWWD